VHSHIFKGKNFGITTHLLVSQLYLDGKPHKVEEAQASHRICLALSTGRER
jgi:hypothetical protein